MSFRVTPKPEYHVGRSWWPHHSVEDACPCPKAACGLVVLSQAREDCPEHGFHKGKSLREIHPAHLCPALTEEP